MGYPADDISMGGEAQRVRLLDLTAHTSLSPIRRGFTPGFVNYKKVFTRLAAASDTAYQLLAQGRWLSLGTPAFSTTKTGRHDIAEIRLKVALKHQKSNQIISMVIGWLLSFDASVVISWLFLLTFLW